MVCHGVSRTSGKNTKKKRERERREKRERERAAVGADEYDSGVALECDGVLVGTKDLRCHHVFFSFEILL